MPFLIRPMFRLWEEPRSVLQRAAVQRGVPGTRHLANRLAFPLTYLPTSEQVASLERQFGFAAGSIGDKAICAAGHGLAGYLGETFAVAHSIRYIRHLCPACVAADRADEELESQADARPWFRSFWALTAVTCCPFHGLRLVSRCDCGGTVAGLDGPLDYCARGHRARLSLEAVSPSELEAASYIIARLDGSHAIDSGLVLDSMTWPQAAKTALRIGLFKLHGREPPGLKGRPPIEIAGEAMGVGFEQLKRFPASFEQLLDELSAPAVRKRGGPVGRYGSRFYSYMQRDDEGHLEPLRTVFERHAGLAAAGMETVSRSQKTRRLWQEPLDASEMRRLRRVIRPPGEPRALTRREALDLCRPLGAVVPIGRIVSDLGFDPAVLKAVAGRRILLPAWNNRGLLRDWYYLQEAIELRQRVIALARPVDSLPAGAIRLHALTGFALKQSESLAAVLAGVVTPLRLAGVSAIGALAVERTDVEAIWSFSVGGRHVSLDSLSRANGMSRDLAAAACKRRLISTRNLRARKAVTTRQAEAFARRFASASALAAELGLSVRELQRHLDDKGCVPVISVIGGRLYERQPAFELAKDLAGSALNRARSARSDTDDREEV